MKKSAFMLGVLMLLVLPPTSVAQQASKEAGSHLGTWQLVATKYGSAKAFTDYPKERQRLKMITGTHFSWVDYDTSSKKVSSSAGGPYSLSEGVYTETIEFVGDGMEKYLGKKQKFMIQIEGDKLTLSGQLSDGFKVEEVWKRVK